MILFKNLTFCNLLSAGNQPVTIDLNKCKTTLIHGTNGSGKSTLLDALCYGLFGKSFRGVNLTQLINTQNKKGLLVEVEFSIGKSDYLVRRGMKPKVFEIFKNGDEKQLLIWKDFEFDANERANAVKCLKQAVDETELPLQGILYWKLTGHDYLLKEEPFGLLLGGGDPLERELREFLR